jgi:hypothetical protein
MHTPGNAQKDESSKESSPVKQKFRRACIVPAINFADRFAVIPAKAGIHLKTMH